MPTKHVTLQLDRIESQQNPDLGIDVGDLVSGGVNAFPLLYTGGPAVFRSSDTNYTTIYATSKESTIRKLTITENGGTPQEIDMDTQCVIKTLGVAGSGSTYDLEWFVTDAEGRTSPVQTKSVEVKMASICHETRWHPSIENAGLLGGMNELNFTTTDWRSSAGQSHSRTDWQIAYDSKFQDMAWSSMDDSSNKTSVKLSIGDVVSDTWSGQLFVRARWKTNVGQVGAWTPTLVYRKLGQQLVTGESVYTRDGEYEWICPQGVTHVHVVCVGSGGSGGCQWSSGGGGGGGLGWKNNIEVTAGQKYKVVVGARGPATVYNAQHSYACGNNSYFIDEGTVCGYGAGRGGPNNGGGTSNGGYGGGWQGDGGGRGGNGAYNGGWTRAGAGAGGYRGNGADANAQSYGTDAPAGSGAGAASGYYSSTYGTPGGGGVGIYGQGADGKRINQHGMPAKGGSGGSQGGYGEPMNGSTVRGHGQIYGGDFGGGGGGSGSHDSSYYGGGAGGRGAVRIIWGAGRSFPDNAA